MAHAIEFAREGFGGPPLHAHALWDEGFYVLEGEVTFQAGDRILTATPGMFVFAPRNMPHTFAIAAGRARASSLCSPLPDMNATWPARRTGTKLPRESKRGFTNWGVTVLARRNEKARTAHTDPPWPIRHRHWTPARGPDRERAERRVGAQSRPALDRARYVRDMEISAMTLYRQSKEEKCPSP